MTGARLPNPPRFLPQRTVYETGLVTLELPWKLENLANQRKHWRADLKAKREQRAMACLVVTAALRHDKPAAAYEVTLTRIAPRPFDDDGAVICWKRIRDGIADALSIDDGNRWRLRFIYRQAKAEAPRTYGARIEIRRLEAMFE